LADIRHFADSQRSANFSSYRSVSIAAVYQLYAPEQISQPSSVCYTSGNLRCLLVQFSTTIFVGVNSRESRPGYLRKYRLGYSAWARHLKQRCARS
jgi:hypothetical protein